tara:strand:- start:8471 stop:8974 length:504 start_codon:yes stop_codon:yes gene_type:complete
MTELRPAVSMEAINTAKRERDTKQPIPKIALLLAYGGAFPFLFLSFCLWFPQNNQIPLIHDALNTYSAIILSFVGAIYWGIYISEGSERLSWHLIVSILPALVGWFALFATHFLSYFVLSAAFGIVCLYDINQTKKGYLPVWFPKLRVPITLLVILSLINAQIFILV